MADDDRYGKVKATLDDNYLLGKQEFPRDLLAAKRLLADFKGTGATAKKRAAPTNEDAGVAFAEGENKTGGFVPTCYGCGRKCKGGWRKCTYITEDHREKVAALDTAGHFRKKRGTVNVVTGDEDDESADDAEEDNKTTTTDYSKLTDADGKPLPSLKELLTLTGYINANVGTFQAENYDDSSWDGDTLANLGVGFLQVEGETGVTFRDPVCDQEWVVQGRRGTNPLKNTSAKKTPSEKLKASNPTSDKNVPAEKPAWIVESCLKNKRLGYQRVSQKSPKNAVPTSVQVHEPRSVSQQCLDLVQNQETSSDHKSKSQEKKSETSVRGSSTSKSKMQAVQLKECGGADSRELAKKPEVRDTPRKECEGTVSSVNGKHVHYPKTKNGRYTLDWWKRALL